MDIAGAMSAFVSVVWSTPTALLLTGAGLLFTLTAPGIQFKALTHGLRVIRGDYDNPEDTGNISHFQALCAALSGTIGLGNISGVAVATWSVTDTSGGVVPARLEITASRPFSPRETAATIST